MTRRSVPALAAFAALAPLLLVPRAASADPSELNRAAGLYHQGNYSTARLELEALLAGGDLGRRDSLVVFQYLGMAWSRLGADSQAVACFHDVLELDSLFRLPRNEDPAILRNFQAALARHAGEAGIGSAAHGNPAATAALPSAAGHPSAFAPEAPALAEASRPGRPEDPLRALSTAPDPPPMSLALGAVPLGGGWLARKRTAQGLSLGLLQAGGLLLSIYASDRQSHIQGGIHGLQGSERDAAVRWQWVQRVTLSTAAGAYLYSLIAAGKE